MLCDHPIQLKNGLIVPCGKCLLCLSHRRDQWSIRMQLHAQYLDSVPFFGTFTYDDDHLVYGCDEPTLIKRDFQLFVKRLKDRYNLYNSDFAFFAAGEYGDNFGRPHMHAILFGFPQLKNMYDRGFEFLNDQIRDVWQNGFVYLGPAEVGGIHYTAKYVLKYATDDYNGVQKPFCTASKGLGSPWLNSQECKFIRYRITHVPRLTTIPLDDVTPESLLSNANDNIKYLKSYLPDFKCTLSDGRRVPLPDYLRYKILGHFENRWDNPYTVLNMYRSIKRSLEYLRDHKEYDLVSSVSMQQQIVDFAKRKIRNRLILNNQL